jgi:hypothetical protein
MNVNTITIGRNEALQKLAAYRGLNAIQKTVEDQRLESLYKAVANGARVLNLVEAFRASGLNELGQPKLAIAVASWRTVYFSPGSNRFRGVSDFWRQESTTPTAKFYEIKLPSDTFAGHRDHNMLSSPVPHIPPNIRPRIALSNFHILFEVEKWSVEYPVDPFLLRHISGDLYVVVAEWELTELEASLLGPMRRGN